MTAEERLRAAGRRLREEMSAWEYAPPAATTSLSDRDKVALLLRQVAASAINGTPPPFADVPELLVAAAFLIDGKTLQEAAREVDATF